MEVRGAELELGAVARAATQAHLLVSVERPALRLEVLVWFVPEKLRELVWELPG